MVVARAVRPWRTARRCGSLGPVTSAVVVRRTLLAAVAAAGAVAAYRQGRRAQLAFGATPQETSAELPGDDLIPAADLVATRAITIRASAADVWPWLAQLGQGRGGFYSYDRLENLAGCDIHSADDVVPQWQGVQVGDELRLHPDFGLPVAVVSPPEALVLHGAGPVDDEEEGEDAVPFDFTWSFVLRQVDDATTRLVVRERYGYRTGWAGRMVEPVSWVSFVMTERMLRGIRDRAERAAARTATPQGTTEGTTPDGQPA